MNILLCGVGGQGTVLASKLIAAAAMSRDIPVMSAETIGMAQRGGSVVSYLRMGNNLHSPLFGKHSADLIIGFEPGETVRMLPYLKEDGTVVVNSNPIMPISTIANNATYSSNKMVEYIKTSVKNLKIVDTHIACSELGSSRIVNILLLGAALDIIPLGFTKEDMAAAIKQKTKVETHKLNLQALHYFNFNSPSNATKY